MKLNKSMLRANDRVTLKCGKTRYYWDLPKALYEAGGNFDIFIDAYDYDLTLNGGDRGYDIIKIEHEDGTVEPWEPKEGEVYYTICAYEKDGYRRATFLGNKCYKLALNRGMIVRTEAEAIEIVKRLDKEGWVR